MGGIISRISQIPFIIMYTQYAGFLFSNSVFGKKMRIIISGFTTLLQISNFEYLMALNTLAGRSYNDITQVDYFLFMFLCARMIAHIICDSVLHLSLSSFDFLAVSSFPLDSF